MNPRDAIILALTPGTPFNEKGLVFRSAATLGAFAGIEPGEVLDLLVGDLGPLVTCKPSKKNKGVMVALKDQLQNRAVPIKIAGGPAFNAPLAAAAQEAQALNQPVEVKMADDIDEMEENLQDDLDDGEDEDF